MSKDELFNEFEKILDDQEKDIKFYMDTYFTKEEAVRHADNIWSLIAKSSGVINLLKFKDEHL